MCFPNTGNRCVKWTSKSFDHIPSNTLSCDGSKRPRLRAFSSLSMLIVFPVSPGDSNATCEAKADASGRENSQRDSAGSRRQPPASADRRQPIRAQNSRLYRASESSPPRQPVERPATGSGEAVLGWGASPGGAGPAGTFGGV